MLSPTQQRHTLIFLEENTAQPVSFNKILFILLSTRQVYDDERTEGAVLL